MTVDPRLYDSTESLSEPFTLNPESGSARTSVPHGDRLAQETAIAISELLVAVGGSSDDMPTPVSGKSTCRYEATDAQSPNDQPHVCRVPWEGALSLKGSNPARQLSFRPVASRATDRGNEMS